MYRLLMICLVICLAAILVSTSTAQTDRATLTGTVTDQSQGAISGARVSLEAAATGVEHVTQTNSAGAYVIGSLAVGQYTASIAAPGFEPLRVEAFSLEVGETRTLNATLKVSAVSSEVEVVAAAPDLNQTSAEIGGVIRGSQITDLPLNGRSWVRLMTLIPGAIDSGSGTQDQVRFAGLSQEDNNFHFDGVDATGINHQFQKVDLRLQLSPEAIAEFRANSAIYSADQGGSAGGQVEIVSKSGTNQFHGSTWEFVRNSVFDARPFTAATLPQFQLNNFGANFGGPVIRNRLFFFVNWEAVRQVLAQSVTGVVPTDAYRAQVIQKSPTLAPIVNAFGRGGSPTKDPNALAWSGLGRNPLDEDSGMFRIDYNISKGSVFFTRFSTDHYSTLFPNGIGTSSTGVRDTGFQNLNTPNTVIGVTHTFSPTVLNDAKIGFNRAEYLEGGKLALPFAVTITGFSSLSIPSSSLRHDNSFSVVDNATFITGRHAIKAGVEIRRMQENKASPNIDQATYSYNNETDFLNNVMNSDSFSGAVPTTGQRKTVASGYVLDEFRIRPNFTLNVGLRYDYFGVDHDILGRGIVVDPYTCPNLVCPSGSDWYFPNTKDLGPRLSLAWTPAARHGKTVIRAGWGIFYGEGQFGHLGGPTGNLATKYTLNQKQAPGLSFPVTPFLGAAVYSVSYGAQDRNRKDLSISEWSVSVQNEIARQTTLQVAYYGSEGAHLWTSTTLNGVNPLTGSRPFAGFSTIGYNSTSGVSNFHAMQIGLNRSLATGLLVSASYQWSHAIDDGPVGGSEANPPQNVNCRSCERGSSSQDIRSYFAASAIWKLPVGRGHGVMGNASPFWNALVGGWELNWVGTARTGLPVNVTVSRAATDLPDQINSNQRPDYVFGQPLYPAGGQTVQEWLNGAAFTVPKPGTWGNAGRNLVRAPGIWQLDTSLAKRFALRERLAATLRADVFNVFNVAHYGTPISTISSGNYGLIQTTFNNNPIGVGTPRQIQLMLRLDF